MPNQFLSDEFGDIEDYFVTDYWLIDQFVGDQLFTWGSNGNGQLGINNTNGKNTPVTTFAGGTTWKQVKPGQHTAAIKTDGTLWTWGRNQYYGQLGINSAFPGEIRSTPVTTFAGGTNWKSVSTGGYHTAAIKTDGTLWNWGSNEFGQIGINQGNVVRVTPVTTFAGGNDWKSVSCGNLYTAAIKTDGSLWTWGRNDAGQLGINDTTNRSTPVTTFAGGNDWKSISCGLAHMAAIKTDGSLWMWGFNSQGRLGTYDGNTRSAPVTTFAGGNDWKQVSCGRDYTAAVKTDGSLWTWGYGGSNLGAGTAFISRSTPITTFAGGTNWKSVCAGRYNTTAMKIDGSLWVWGLNTSGQLGTNDTIERFTPVTTFAGGNNWKLADCNQASDTTVAIKSGLNVDLS